MHMRIRYSDEVSIEELRKRNRNVIEYLYQEFYPVLRNLVRKNSGNNHDVQDLIQDAMVVLYASCCEPQFILKCALKTYFVAICKNLWLQRLERKFRLLYQADLEVNDSEASYNRNEQHENEVMLEKKRLMYKNLRLLPADCQKLLLLYMVRTPYAEIARVMNVKDEIYVKTRKYTCKNLLRKKMMNDPECHQIFDYE